jgi:SAM-dependent methyltransferase
LINSYQSLEASLHDVFWATEGPPAELPLMRSFLQEHPGKSLEIGSGSGRLLIPLRREGFDVEGLESSAEMIAMCQANASENLVVPLHLGSMDDWTPSSRYASLMIPAFTLQLSRDPVAALVRFADWLQDGGTLYMSTFTPLAEMLGELPAGEWYPDHQTELQDGTLAVIYTKHQIDATKQILDREHRYEIFDKDGAILATHESRQQLRWFRREQWKQLLNAARFRIEKQFADFKPQRKSLKEAIVVTTIARKIVG